MKRLEGAHHRCLLLITWKDKIRNMVAYKVVQEQTGLEKLEDIVQERKGRWLGHVVVCVDDKTGYHLKSYSGNHKK